jgi:hypothetical protein
MARAMRADGNGCPQFLFANATYFYYILSMKIRFFPGNPRPFLLAAAMSATVALGLLLSRTESVQNADEDILLQLRGKRNLPAGFLLAAIDESDVETLGGWPVTRDYYGYLIHILTEKNARAVGLDVLLDSPGRQYPEYDRMLEEFIRTSGRVVLPNVLHQDSAVVLVGPLPVFARAAAGTGFSNLGDGPVVRRIPLVASKGDTLLPSFGLALARTFLGADIGRENGHVVLSVKGRPPIRIPVDKKGRMPLNPPGDVSSIASMRICDLMRRYETAPDSVASFPVDFPVAGLDCRMDGAGMRPLLRASVAAVDGVDGRRRGRRSRPVAGPARCFTPGDAGMHFHPSFSGDVPYIAHAEERA